MPARSVESNGPRTYSASSHLETHLPLPASLPVHIYAVSQLVPEYLFSTFNYQLLTLTVDCRPPSGGNTFHNRFGYASRNDTAQLPSRRSKQIPRRDRAPFHHRLERSILGARHHVRHIVQCARQVRIPRQDGRQQQPVSAPHIHDGMNFAE